MKHRLLDLLACPICGEEVGLKVMEEEARERFFPGKVPCRRRCAWRERIRPETSDLKNVTLEDCADCYGLEIISGEVSCPQRHSFPISRGVLRALELQGGTRVEGASSFQKNLERHGKVKATFDQEWRMVDPEKDIYGHSRDEEEEDFFRRLCVTASFLANKLILDVGCGIGRLANRLSRVPSEVIGVELSSGVDKAWEEARCHPQAHFIQGNLYTLPFRPRVFDYIYSKGVLQYVYDSREAFRQISLLVAPGGGISITLYPPLPHLFQLLNRMVRAITLRLPLSLVHLLGALAVPFLSLAWKMSGVQERPISWSDRGHMIFNWLASDYQNFHSVKEVISWYREEGFGGIRSSAIPIGVFGQWEGNEP